MGHKLTKFERLVCWMALPLAFFSTSVRAWLIEKVEEDRLARLHELRLATRK